MKRQSVCGSCSVATFLATNLAALAHVCPGGTACSWDDLVAAWNASHTADDE